MRGNEPNIPGDEKVAIQMFQIPMRGNEDESAEYYAAAHAGFKSP